MGDRRPPRGLLSRSPAFGRLLAARAVSVVGDAVGGLAILVHVQESEGTGTAVGLLLLVASLPRLFSPVAGVVADRLDYRTVLVGGEVAQGMIVGVAAVWLPPFPVLLFLAFAKAAAATVAEPAGRVAVPDLVDDADLPAANSLIGGLREGGEVVGPLLGGVLVALAGVRAGLAVDALTFVISIPLLLRVPRSVDHLATVHERPPTVVGSAVEGLRFTMAQPVARAAALGMLFIGLSAGEDVALPFLARLLGSGASGIGALFAAVALGVIAGYGVRARLGTRIPPGVGFAAGAGVIATANALTGLSPAIALAVTFQVVRGVGIAVLETDLQTLIQRNVPRAVMGRVFANVYGAVNVAAAVSVFGAGVLLDATSARVVLVAAGAAAGVASIGSFILLRRAVAKPPGPESAAE